jgi:hypothetical protein
MRDLVPTVEAISNTLLILGCGGGISAAALLPLARRRQRAAIDCAGVSLKREQLLPAVTQIPHDSHVVHGSPAAERAAEHVSRAGDGSAAVRRQRAAYDFPGVSLELELLIPELEQLIRAIKNPTNPNAIEWQAA